MMKKIFNLKNGLLAVYCTLMVSNVDAQTMYPNGNGGTGSGGNSGASVDANTVFVGFNAGGTTTGTLNTYVGAESGRMRNGTFNSFLGYRTGRAASAITGSENCYIGAYCGENFTGSNNTMIGEAAGFNGAINAGGDNNSFFGGNAGEGFQSGSGNTFIGANAHRNSVNVSNSIAVGINGFVRSNSSIIMGIGSFTNPGSDNSIAIGSGARVLDNSSNSIAIGNLAWVDPSFMNATAIGDHSYANCTNCMTLGNGYNGTTNYRVGIGTSNPLGNFVVADMIPGTPGSNDIRFLDLPSASTVTNVLTVDATGATPGRLRFRSDIAFNTCQTTNFVPRWNGTTLACGVIQDNGTNVGIGAAPGTVAAGNAQLAPAGQSATVGTSVRLDVAGYIRGTIVLASSDERFKEEIKDIPNALEKIKQINGVNYKWKKTFLDQRQAGTELQSGFIAQDLEKSIPEVVYKDDKGEYSINYMGVIPYLTEAIKEQQTQLEKKDADIAEMKERILSMELALASCCTNYETSQRISASQTEKAALDQNNPNPFSESTTIRYYIPSTAMDALLKIYSINGEELKSVKLNGTGKGQVMFSGGDLSSGTYVYNLIVDGKQVDSKWMTLTK